MTESERPRRRLLSVDTFRGAVLAIMLLTPATGSADHFPVLHHAHWSGLTVSDLVFPTFLVTSGLSLAFLLRPPVTTSTRWRLVRRLLLLWALGLAYNAYGATGLDLGSLRFTGVLQTIGTAGALAAAAVLLTRRADGTDRTPVLVAVTVGITAVHGLALWLVTAPCDFPERCSPLHTLDQRLLGVDHVYTAGSLGFDPEGVAATVVATALVLVGYLAGRHLQPARLAAGGVALVAVAGMLDPFQPVTKRLFTPSFVAVSAGVALCLFAAFLVVLDGRDERSRWMDVGSWPLVALGRNALVVYLGERLLLQTASMVHVDDGRTLEAVLLTDVLPIGEPGVHLAYTALLCAVLVAVTGVLHARRWYLAL